MSGHWSVFTPEKSYFLSVRSEVLCTTNNFYENLKLNLSYCTMNFPVKKAFILTGFHLHRSIYCRVNVSMMLNVHPPKMYSSTLPCWEEFKKNILETIKFKINTYLQSCCLYLFGIHKYRNRKIHDQYFFQKTHSEWCIKTATITSACLSTYRLLNLEL